MFQHKERNMVKRMPFSAKHSTRTKPKRTTTPSTKYRKYVNPRH
jgi:hypothetical protein